MELASSQAYANFRAWVPRNVLTVGVLHPQSWLYYDWGPRTYREPIVCFHSLIGSPECFFHQVISLAPRGYRILSLQIPPYWTISEFCDALHAFLDMLSLNRIHVYAAGLGGFLALHYAARKPDRVASVILTHSFLSSDSVKNSIPYSSAVLHWLPDFLVRSTMRAMLPKGRASREQANAAEFAIGHTMTASRQLLASRLSLFIVPSTVATRLPIQESRITLIDTLDRPQPATQLSEHLATQLPNARRAFIKDGGDFPYLAVPEDVNVHLVVHLRRHAPEPDASVLVPPPARPHPLPEAVIQRKREEAIQIQKKKDAAARKEAADGPGVPATPSDATGQRKVPRSHEDVVAEAHVMVASEEQEMMERFAFEITRLREFLPERDDAYITAVMMDCQGDIEAAISNAMQDVYGDRFYDDDQMRRIEEAVAVVVQSQREENGTDGTSGATAGEGDGGATADSEDDGVAQRYEAVGDTHDEQDPLRVSDVPMHGGSGGGSSGGGGEVEERGDISDDGVEVGIPLSPNAKHVERDDGGGDGENIMESEDEDREDNASGVEQLGNAGGRGRRGRRRSVGSAEGVEAYVTSEKVGMRSEGSLVGRGPAPFKNTVAHVEGAGEESWVRAPPPLMEEDVAEVVVEASEESNLTSGASLLETPENPLELPTDEGVGREVKEAAGIAWKTDFPQDGGKQAAKSDTGPEGETVGDGWESYRIQDEKEGEDNEGREVDEEAEPDQNQEETDEQRRLRMWSMSAVAAASKSVPR